MRPIAASACLLLSLAAAALAQEGTGPVMGSSAEQGAPAADAEREVTEVLVLGDAIGGGLGAGLMRLAEQEGAYEITIRFNEESGLARPEVYDWAGTVSKIIRSNSYDVIVVMLGINDRQMIRDGNFRYVFNTPEWIDTYRTQVDMLLDELADSRAEIIWVGMPPVADPEYDSALRVITDLQKERVERRKMNFLDIRPAFSGPDGRFTDEGPDETGEVTRLRGRDGVSFYKAGNNRLAQLVLAAITGASGAPAVTENPAVSQRPAPKMRDVPVFGQALGGESLTIRPEDVTANAILIAQEGVDPASFRARIKTIAAQGSAAEMLFTKGLPQSAPKGRADDFSAPTPAQE